jgi:hypothetical protein
LREKLEKVQNVPENPHELDRPLHSMTRAALEFARRKPPKGGLIRFQG